MSYEDFRKAVQEQLHFWFGRIRSDALFEVNCREAYALGMRVNRTAHDIAFGLIIEGEAADGSTKTANISRDCLAS